MSTRQRDNGKPLPVPAQAVRDLMGITDAQVHVRGRGDKKMITARELKALDLLVLGANYGQIAQVMGLKTRAGAVQLVQRALAKRAQECAETTVPEARALYLDRLEKLFQRWMPAALGNPAQAIPADPVAAKLVLDMMTRFARVTGIEAPVRVEEQVDVTIHDPDAQRARVLDSLQSFAKRAEANTIDGTVVDAA